MKKYILVFFIILIAFAVINKAQGKKSKNAKLVRQFIEDFNTHNVNAMLELITKDSKWLYIISPDSVSVETNGKKEFREGIISYYESIPSIRSEIEDLVVSGDYVTLREHVFWEKDGKELTQSALCVYQIKGSKIYNVWYFPADK